ncbi:hypothetical protein [Streptomyces poriticola]|uniref:hypothetical protein n=1 Tax=Streptomyces poriticola TaxID=3120506 RepID=UPI002FCDEA46
MSRVPPPATARAGRRRARSRGLVRILVLALVLLLPGTSAQAQSGPTAVVSAEGGGGQVLEYEPFDTALRAPARTVRRRGAPRHPGPSFPADRAPTRTDRRLAAVPPPGPPYFLRGLRSVVLRC